MSSEFRGNNRSMVARSINDIKALFDKLDLIFLYRFTWKTAPRCQHFFRFVWLAQIQVDKIDIPFHTREVSSSIYLAHPPFAKPCSVQHCFAIFKSVVFSTNNQLNFFSSVIVINVHIMHIANPFANSLRDKLILFDFELNLNDTGAYSKNKYFWCILCILLYDIEVYLSDCVYPEDWWCYCFPPLTS